MVPSVPPRSRGVRFLYGLLPWLLYVVGFYALTFPAMHAMGDHLLGDDGDGWQNVWNLWSVRRAVLTGTNPWFTQALFAPDGVTLVGATLNPINGFLAVPLGCLLTELQTYNVLVVLAFAMTGWATMLLAEQLGVGRPAALLAGAAFTFCSYHMAHGLGHMQLITVQFVPLFLWQWLRLLAAPSVARGVGAGVLLMLVQWSDHYYTLYSVMVGGILLAFHVGQHRRALLRGSFLRPLTAFVVTCFVCLGPLAYALLAHGDAGGWVGAHHETAYVNDLLGPLIPASNWGFRDLTSWFWQANPFWERRTAEFNNFIAPTVWGLAAVACLGLRQRVRWRGTAARWLTIGVVFYLLSLGPCLQVMKASFDDGWMPYHLLKVLFPPLRYGGMPVRFAVIYLLAAALMAGIGAQILCGQWTRGTGRWLGAALVLVLLVDLRPWSFPVTAPPSSVAIDALNPLPKGFVVGLEWDKHGPWWQVRHGKPMPYGYLARYPTAIHDTARKLEELAKRGRYGQLMDQTGGRYLVVPQQRGHQPDPERFVRLVADESFAVYVEKTDPVAPTRAVSPVR